VSSYTPTVRALLRAQRAATPLKRDNISLALVAEKRALQRHLRIIPGVDEEIEYVAAVASKCNIKTTHRLIGSTTIADTTAVMQVVNCVHLACHGIQDVGDAAQSGFCLGDGRLTIAKLVDLKLDDAFLAFLSACETAKGDELQPDQAMHLAAAMLFSGFKNVIATMWYVPKVAKWFYEELLAKEVVDANSVAYALDFAVGKLRDSGVSPDRWAPFIHMGA
jgi:CHAT domain-containing protein